MTNTCSLKIGLYSWGMVDLLSTESFLDVGRGYLKNRYSDNWDNHVLVF